MITIHYKSYAVYCRKFAPYKYEIRFDSKYPNKQRNANKQTTD
jgi:hypothetical protein